VPGTEELVKQFYIFENCQQIRIPNQASLGVENVTRCAIYACHCRVEAIDRVGSNLFFYKEDDFLLLAVPIDIFYKTNKLTSRRKFPF
jgi:hypothetical protein